MIGSEKQIAWATQIIECATSTCKTNIEKFEKLNIFPETVAQYKKALATLEMLDKSDKGQDAAWIISHRDMISNLTSSIK